MAASFIMRTGLPNAFLKSNPTQPLPRCLGSLRILPSRTGEGNPIEMASNSQSETKGLIWATIARGVNLAPDLNFLLSAREIISFTFEPPTSMTRTFFFKVAFELQLASVMPIQSCPMAQPSHCFRYQDSSRRRDPWPR